MTATEPARQPTTAEIADALAAARLEEERRARVADANTERLRLIDDGTIDVVLLVNTGGVLSPQTYRLRRPTLGELRDVVTLAEAADEEINSRRELHTRTLNYVGSPDSGYAQAFQLALLTLAGVDIAVEDLPAWTGDVEAIGPAITHWRTVPLDRGTPTRSPDNEPASSGSTPTAPAGKLRPRGVIARRPSSAPAQE